MGKWIKTSFPGVRFREHETRKHGVRPDRYFTIRYKLNGRDKEEGLGWSSQGMTAEKANARRSELTENQRIGQGVRTLQERREREQARREREKAEKEKLDRDTLSFGDFFHETYFPQAQANKSTRSHTREESLFRLWIGPVIKDVSMKAVSPFHLEKIKKNMADAGKSPRSAHYALAVVRQVFNHARILGLYEGEPPTTRVKKPTADNRRMRFLSHDEAGRLLKALREKTQEVYEIALVSLQCGLRAGEIFSLTWRDLDLERGILTLWNTQNTRTRQAFMTGEVKAMLAEKEHGGDNDLVFPDRDGGKRTVISKTFNRTVSELGLNNGVTDRRQKVVFHSLRHSYASWLVERGVDLFTVKELMGHSTLSMTERYSHLGNGTLQRAVKELEAGIKQAQGGAKVVELRP